MAEGALQFSESGDRLYFKIKNSVSDVGDTTRQKVKSDLSMWKWDAPYIPTMNCLFLVLGMKKAACVRRLRPRAA